MGILRKQPGCDHHLKLLCMPPPAPLHPWTWPEAPWQSIHVDFEERMFLVAIDAHSKWTEAFIRSSAIAEKTMEKLSEISHFVFPEQLVSDIFNTS